MADLAARIDDLWDHRDELAPGDAEADTSVTEAVELLDTVDREKVNIVVIVGDARSIEMAVRTGKGGERITRLAKVLREIPRR